MKTIKRGRRRGQNRYFCSLCGHSFSVDHRRKKPILWVSHIDGIPFRKLANEHNGTAMGMYKIVHAEMEKLPSNTLLSKKYCSNWSGILCIDGKFVKVKGFQKKVPFIYSVDYLTHDIPICLLALSESETAFSRFFSLLEEIGYPLKVVIGDDSGALKKVLKWRLPKVSFQLCNTHYLENVRQALNVRTTDTYKEFFWLFEKLFVRGQSREARMHILKTLKSEYGQNRLVLALLVDVYNRYEELFAYEGFSFRVPHSNNMIEAYNSHLNPRLVALKGFKSFGNAELWLNAWTIRRRTKPLTDCEKPFLELNGKAPIEMSVKYGTDLQKITKFLYEK